MKNIIIRKTQIFIKVSLEEALILSKGRCIYTLDNCGDLTILNSRDKYKRAPVLYTGVNHKENISILEENQTALISDFSIGQEVYAFISSACKLNHRYGLGALKKVRILNMSLRAGVGFNVKKDDGIFVDDTAIIEGVSDPLKSSRRDDIYLCRNEKTGAMYIIPGDCLYKSKKEAADAILSLSESEL